jgi:demethylmenaquinone methyltransferase/2-methoxy-6-polyprenyl-1,4-benzoquinol methylase
MTAEQPGGDPAHFAQRLFAPLPARYDLLEEVLSFGQNRRWRRLMCDHALAGAPGRLLDVATGTGGVAVQLAARSAGQVVGVDVTEAMLRQAQQRVRTQRIERVSLVVGRAERLPFADRSFDALTFTYLLRYVTDPAQTLGELARVLRPGAAMASLEFFVPPARSWHAAWWAYTRGVLPVAGRLLGGAAWQRVGSFLGPNIEDHYRRFPLEWTRRAWEDAGLTGVGHRVMSLGGGLVMWGTRADG